jgi:hypothetical protein
MTLADFTGPSRPSGDQTNYQHCPACGDSGWHCYVGPDGGWDCKRCGARGYIEGAVPISLPTTETEHEWAPIDPPETDPLTDEAYRYLHDRGIDRILAGYLGLRMLRGEDRLYIPYPDPESGALLFWSGRALAHDARPKYFHSPGRPCPIWQTGLPNALPVLVEGIFDAVAVAMAGFRGIALSGKRPTGPQWSQLRRVLRRDVVVRVCLDGDAIRESIRLSQELGLAGYASYIVPLEDGQDPGGMSPDELMEVLL